MEINKIDDEKWTDAHMASLGAAGAWQPDAARGFAKLHAREAAGRTSKRRWLLAGGGAVLAGLVLVAIPAPQACAQCVRPTAQLSKQAVPAPVVEPEPIAPEPIAPEPIPLLAKPAPVAPATGTPEAPKPSVETVRNFKESGSPSAPIVCELYSDYECPACGELYRETMPAFIEQYVKTGKVRLVHRDMALPQHRYAKLAARYANAAGSLGYYELAVRQIFQTQAIWNQDGGIDGQLALVLPADAMQKVRDRVQSDPTLDSMVTADMAAAGNDRITQTPTMIMVFRGTRSPIQGVAGFGVLKSYLDELLARP